jgi:flagellar biosynthetic protein FlhB
MPEHSGEKTEQPTPRRLEEAAKRGQFARSAEVQTIFVLGAGMLALTFAGREMWHQLVCAFTGTLGHLHQFRLSLDQMQAYGLGGALVWIQCVAPVVLAGLVGGLLAGGIQSRFQTASEALRVDWTRLDPVAGLKRIFSGQSVVPTLVAMVKLGTILVLIYSEVKAVLNNPIFGSPVGLDRVGAFMANTALGLVARVCMALALIAAADFAYQHWKTSRALMMTKEELKEELKHTEGNPLVRARMRRRALRYTQRRMLIEVARADVVVTNPVHVAVALRYDRRTMRAPKVVAKGARLNAQRIKEVAQQHQVPIVENPPVARLLFKHVRLGAEIPVQLYAAVAEILAWVYRVNRYRYYTEGNRLYAA